jgi:hypothetical protein
MCWNLIGCGMITLLHVLLPSSIPLTPLSRCAFIPTKNFGAHFKNVILIFLTSLKIA